MAKRVKPKARPTANQIPPAGMRPDRKGPYGVPWPDRESLSEEYRWRQEHQQ